MRGTADQVALAEKLIQDLDKPKAEVVVDVIVMEANRARVRDLYATITTAGGAPGINIPIALRKTPSVLRPARPGDADTGDDTGRLRTRHGCDYRSEQDQQSWISATSLCRAGRTHQGVMTDSQTRVMQQPQVRAVENAEGFAAESVIESPTHPAASSPASAAV